MDAAAKPGGKRLREALAISREVGTQFCGPKVLGALARAVDENDERARAAGGRREVSCASARSATTTSGSTATPSKRCCRPANPAGVLLYVTALEDYTRREPLPWAELFAAARPRARAPPCGEPADEAVRKRASGACEPSCCRLAFGTTLPRSMPRSPLEASVRASAACLSVLPIEAARLHVGRGRSEA